MSCYLELTIFLNQNKLFYYIARSVKNVRGKKENFLSLLFINFNLYHSKTYSDLCGSKLILLL